jgi:hypothetical protein
MSISLKIVVSSAYKYGSLANSMASGRSFIYNTKSTGPRTDSCGIPEVTDFHSEDSPLTDTFCLRLSRMLKFHPDKCKTMRIGRSKVEKHEYTLKADLKPMEETIAEKDVGVTIDNKLSFDKHITEKVSKANSHPFF